MRAALITVSTSRTAGRAEDESGPRLEALAESLDAEVVARELVADRRDEIAALLRRCADQLDCDLILTTGGTGFAPDDVTPEATRDVLEREAPGVAEAIRLESRPHTRKWMVSRGVAGVRGRSLIVNLPGSPSSIDQVGDVLREAVPHAVSLLRGESSAHRQPR